MVMAKELEGVWHLLSITKEEKDAIEVVGLQSSSDLAVEKSWVMGRLLTRRPFNEDAMISTFKVVWRVAKELEILEGIVKILSMLLSLSGDQLSNKDKAKRKLVFPENQLFNGEETVQSSSDHGVETVLKTQPSSKTLVNLHASLHGNVGTKVHDLVDYATVGSTKSVHSLNELHSNSGVNKGMSTKGREVYLNDDVDIRPHEVEINKDQSRTAQ
ncbi:hypothetical protein PTKIN_Ptkin09bG0150700 [Pterospermum kingtungense]